MSRRSLILWGGGALILVLAQILFFGGSEGAKTPPMRSTSAGAQNSSRPPGDNFDSSSRAPSLQGNNEQGFFDRVLPESSVQPSEMAAGKTYPARPPRRSVVIVLPSSPATPDKAGGTELELALAPGVKEPAVMVATENGLTPQQAEALDATLEAFAQRVQTAPDAELEKTWEKEKAAADAAYRNILGDAALNQQNAEAAVRALGYPSAPPPANKQ